MTLYLSLIGLGEHFYCSSIDIGMYLTNVFLQMHRKLLGSISEHTDLTDALV
jgi:hypothetical protein